jgi:hypothetical protein
MRLLKGSPHKKITNNKTSVVDPDSLNPDPDMNPDPAFEVNPFVPRMLLLGLNSRK